MMSEATGNIGKLKAQEAITAHFQQDRCQHNRPGGRRLHVRIRQPCVHRPHRHFHRETGKERQPQQRLHAADDLEAPDGEGLGGELVRSAGSECRWSRLHEHRHHRDQHQDRAEEGDRGRI